MDDAICRECWRPYDDGRHLPVEECRSIIGGETRPCQFPDAHHEFEEGDQ